MSNVIEFKKFKEDKENKEIRSMSEFEEPRSIEYLCATYGVPYLFEVILSSEFFAGSKQSFLITDLGDLYSEHDIGEFHMMLWQKGDCFLDCNVWYATEMLVVPFHTYLDDVTQCYLHDYLIDSIKSMYPKCIIEDCKKAFDNI